MPSLVGSKRRLQGHVQKGGIFTNSDLRSAQAFQSVWEDVEFHASRLSMGNFVNSRWTDCKIEDTTFYGANANAATFHGVTFSGCDMEQASFQSTVFRDVLFLNCRLAYSTFALATLHDVTFSGCNLHGADLDYAAADGVSYKDTMLWGVKTAFACTFWNGEFDEESCRRFLALVARVYPDEDVKAKLTAIAGESTYAAVDRLMRPQPDEPEF